MRNRILVIGSVITAALIVLLSFTSITVAQATESNNGRMILLRHIKDKIVNKFEYPNESIFFLFILLLIILDFIVSGGRRNL